MDGQVLPLDLSGEVAGQVEAVVGEFRLLGNQGDLRRGGGSAERLHGGNPGDPGADHDDPRRLLRLLPRAQRKATSLPEGFKILPRGSAHAGQLSGGSAPW